MQRNAVSIILFVILASASVGMGTAAADPTKRSSPGAESQRATNPEALSEPGREFSGSASSHWQLHVDVIHFMAACSILALAVVWIRRRDMNLGVSVLCFVLGAEFADYFLRAITAVVPDLVVASAPDEERHLRLIVSLVVIALLVSHLSSRARRDRAPP